VVGDEGQETPKYGKLSGKVRWFLKFLPACISFLPRGKYMDMVMEYCHRYGLEERESAVSAKIGKYGNAWICFHPVSLKVRWTICNFFQDTGYFEKPNWESIQKKEVVHRTLQMKHLSAHPFKLDEDGLRVRYLCLAERRDCNKTVGKTQKSPLGFFLCSIWYMK
jgi:hypothetical protein